MAEPLELHVSNRLKALLPSLSKEELKQLKANIDSDGEILDPLVYWHDGRRNVVIDGMHRFAIARKGSLAFPSKSMEFDSYEDAELWILNHQLGKRNLSNPKEFRDLIGKTYNREKGRRGGDHTTQEAKYQSDTLLPDAAQKIAEKAGVSASTVKRNGARVAAIEGLSKAAKVAAEKATDAEVKRLAKLEPAEQDKVARAVRVGQAKTVSEAIKKTGPKPAGKAPKASKGREVVSSAKLVDQLTKQHIGHVARGLSAIAEANGGEGAQFKIANDALNGMILALKEMRGGKK